MQGNNFDAIEGAKSYIGTKQVTAKPMNRLSYNNFKGWDLPADEDGSDEGYIVQYTGGYVSWSPEAQFHSAYRLTTGLNFGLALEALKAGSRVARAGWNGKGMWLVLQPGSKGPIPMTSGSVYARHGLVEVQIDPHIDMMTVRGTMQPGWLASQSDMLANDWSIVE